MEYRKFKWYRGILLLLYLLIVPSNVEAYLDPGTGSYILQLLLAGLLGAAFAVKLFWTKIKIFFVNLFSKRPKNE